MTNSFNKSSYLYLLLIVFLDLPAPWEAVASAKKAFKQNKVGKICTFSPCIEQISRTVTALNEHGFVDIQMYECLIRFNEIRVIPMWTIDEAMEKQRAVEKKRKRATPRVVRDENNNNNNNTQDDESSSSGHINKSVKVEPSVDDSNQSSAAATPNSTTGSEMEDSVSTTTSTPVLGSETPAAEASITIAEPRERIEPKNVVVTRLPAEQRGHTSYLMFATFTPATQGPSLTETKAAAAAAASASSSK
jgi:tRNA (adenine57-N1/adenine58-N1)-methyltransferase